MAIGVVEVVSGSPADRAGMRPGDVLLAIDGNQLETVDELYRHLARATIGASALLTVLRDGRTIELPATLAASG